MSLVLDSGGVYALYDADDAHHAGVTRVVAAESGKLILPAVLLAEIDYLLRRFLGVAAELDFLEAVQIGAFTLEALTEADLHRASALIRQYRDLDLGLADACVIATAERLNIARVLTVDYRDFRAVRTRLPLRLLPADDD